MKASCLFTVPPKEPSPFEKLPAAEHRIAHMCLALAAAVPQQCHTPLEQSGAYDTMGVTLLLFDFYEVRRAPVTR